MFEWEKKKNRNARSPNAEGVRSFNAARASGGALWVPPVDPGGARPPNDIWCILVWNALSGKALNAARDLGERCKPPAGQGGARSPNDIWCIFGLKMFYLASPWMHLGDLGERCKLPQFECSKGVWGSAVLLSSLSGSGRSPAAKRHLVHFWSENALSGKTLTS